MKKVKTTIRVKDMATLANELIRLFDATDSVKGDQYLQEVFGEMRTVEASLTDVLDTEKIVSQLFDLDAVRDEAYRDMSDIVLGYTKIRVNNFAANATVVQKVLDGMSGDITRENYKAESASIKSVLNDLDSNTVRQAIDQLPGLREAIEDLRKAEAEFLKVSDQYNLEHQDKKELPNATDLKKSLLDLINNRLVDDLTGMAKRNPQQYGHFANTAEGYINTANRLVKSRSGKDSDESSEKK